MITIADLAIALSQLTLTDVRKLAELVYQDYNLEFNLSVDVYRMREQIRQKSWSEGKPEEATKTVSRA